MAEHTHTFLEIVAGENWDHSSWPVEVHEYAHNHPVAMLDGELDYHTHIENVRDEVDPNNGQNLIKIWAKNWDVGKNQEGDTLTFNLQIEDCREALDAAWARHGDNTTKPDLMMVAYEIHADNPALRDAIANYLFSSWFDDNLPQIGYRFNQLTGPIGKIFKEIDPPTYMAEPTLNESQQVERDPIRVEADVDRVAVDILIKEVASLKRDRDKASDLFMSQAQDIARLTRRVTTLESKVEELEAS